MPGREEFTRELGALGYELDLRADGRVQFFMDIEAGPFAGERVRIGLDVPDDFPRNPPPGPNVSPRLVTTRGGAPGGLAGAVNPSPFGEDFEYWSRPYGGWGNDGYTAKAYLAHLRALFFKS